MADICPLTPLRYDPARLAAVVAPPYDVISSEERAELVARDAQNVVRLILPEGDGDMRYANAAALLGDWVRGGVLTRDSEPAFYRYEQTFEVGGPGALSRSRRKVTRRGFLALVRLVPFSERVVLPHERTLSGPKEDRLKLFRATRTNLSPGFMLYSDPRGRLDDPLDTGREMARFQTPDGVEHAVAKVSAPDAIGAIVDGLAAESLLIADGHHRYETALRYSQEVDLANPQAGVRAEHRYFMTFLANADSPELVVFPTHRHVHSLPSFSMDQLLSRARETFEVNDLERGTAADEALDRIRQSDQGRTSLAVAAGDGRVAILTIRRGLDLSAHPTLRRRIPAVRGTDVAVLHDAILEHILGIGPEAQEAKTNLWYPQDATAALGALRAGKGQALFLMNATPIAQLRAVVEEGGLMPQKSTFFHPKVVTGLAIHTLDPTRRVPAFDKKDAGSR